MKPDILIEPHYLPNILYLSRFLIYRDIIINDENIFIKQTFRNRTYILTTNGILPLIIPLKKGKTRLSFKDVAIDHKINWGRIHWQSILSAYNKSPYFFHYRDHFEKHFKAKTKFLLDFNILLISEIIRILELDNVISLLSRHDKNEVNLADNLTGKIDAGESAVPGFINYKYTRYMQVFSDRFDFVPGLSVIDLIFNTGPEAKQIMQKGLS